MNDALAVCNDLLLFERGKGELVIVNATYPRPLFVKRGREYIYSFLQGVRDLQKKKKVLERFPNDAALLDLLQEHHIVHRITDLQEHRPPPRCPKNCRVQTHISLYLLLAQSCNLGCIYCLNGSVTYQKEKNLRMTENVAWTAIERYLAILAPGSTLEIVFFGGEPLLNWPLAKKTILHCEEVLKDKFPGRDIRYHFTTNLTIFPREIIEWARKYTITFLCDVDGPANIHNKTRPYRSGGGSHGVTAGNIQRLREQGIQVALRSTVTSYNVDHMLEISAHHKELGGAGSAFVAVNPITSDETILSESIFPEPDRFIQGLIDVYHSDLWKPEELFPMNTYIERVRGKEQMSCGCGAPYGNTPVVDIDGNVYACIYLVGIKKYFVGNIFEPSFPRQDVLEDMHAILDVDAIPGCNTCSWRYFCGGGCPVGRLTVSGNPNAGPKTIQYIQEIACKTTRAMVEQLLWHYAYLAR